MIFPLFSKIKGYSTKLFSRDLSAGVLVSVLMTPQCVAYSFLAGMPPIYGLYAALIPPIIYALMGTSRYLSVGPVAISAILVLQGVSNLAEPFSESYIALVLLLGLLVGLAQIILGLLRLGTLANFISHPVMSGFVSAAALIIIINQLKDILGITIPKFEYTYEILRFAVAHCLECHFIPLVIFSGGIILMSLLKRLNRKIPYALIAVVLSTLVTFLLGLDEYGLDTIGHIESGAPQLYWPAISYQNIIDLLPTALTVALIGFVESISIAKVLEDDQSIVEPNKELVALGTSKSIGAFFGALPTSGSFSRSALNHQSNAFSQVSSIVTAGIILLTLLFLTPLFYYLPKAILAAIIVFSVIRLIDLHEFRYLWKSHKRDFWIMVTTFVFTLLVSIEVGVTIGILLSLMLILSRSSKPRISVLGRVPGTSYYRNTDIIADLELFEGKLILRLEDQLYFGNADYFKRKIKNIAKAYKNELREVILDAKSIHELDSSGVKALSSLTNYLDERNVKLKICGAMAPFRRRLKDSGLWDKIGSDQMFDYLNDGVQS